MLVGARSRFAGAELSHCQAFGCHSNEDVTENDSVVMAGSLLGHDSAVMLPGFYSFCEPLGYYYVSGCVDCLFQTFLPDL